MTFHFEQKLNDIFSIEVVTIRCGWGGTNNGFVWIFKTPLYEIIINFQTSLRGSWELWLFSLLHLYTREPPAGFPKVTPLFSAAAKSLQSCPTPCDPIDGSPPGSPIPGILQARTLEWVAISFSNEWKWKVKVKSLNHVQLLATPWTAAHQAPLSMGFSRQEYWGREKQSEGRDNRNTSKQLIWKELLIWQKNIWFYSFNLLLTFI